MVSDDYRSMFDSKYLGAWDLPPGRTIVVTIDHVEAAQLTNARGTNKKPIVFFKGKEKGLVLNKTNGKAVAAMYGPKTSKWVGKPIAIYSTTTSVGGETVDCIRVRPTIPTGAKNEPAPPEPETSATNPEEAAHESVQ